MKNKKIFSILLALMLLVLPVFNMAKVSAEEGYTVHFEVPEECGLDLPDFKALPGEEVELPEIVYRKTCAIPSEYGEDIMNYWWSEDVGVSRHTNSFTMPDKDVTIKPKMMPFGVYSDNWISCDKILMELENYDCTKLNDKAYLHATIKKAHELDLLEKHTLNLQTDNYEDKTVSIDGTTYVEGYVLADCRNYYARFRPGFVYCINLEVNAVQSGWMDSGVPTFSKLGGETEQLALAGWFNNDDSCAEEWDVYMCGKSSVFFGYRYAMYAGVLPTELGINEYVEALAFTMTPESYAKAVAAYELDLAKEDEEEPEEDDEEIEIPSTDGDEEEEIEVPKTSGDEEEISTPNTGFFALMSGASSDVLMFMIAGALCGGAFTYTRLKR